MIKELAVAVNTYFPISGAPSAEAIARTAARVLDAPSVQDMGSGCWMVADRDWCVTVLPLVATEPGEAPLLAVVDVARDVDSHNALLTQLSNRLFAGLVDTTNWGVEMDSDVPGFPPRSRTAVI